MRTGDDSETKKRKHSRSFVKIVVAVVGAMGTITATLIAALLDGVGIQ